MPGGDQARHACPNAAERLRRGDYYCCRLGLHLSWIGDRGGFWDEISFHEISFHETRDTGFLLTCLGRLRRQVPPISCGPPASRSICASTRSGRDCRR